MAFYLLIVLDEVDMLVVRIRMKVHCLQEMHSYSKKRVYTPKMRRITVKKMSSSLSFVNIAQFAECNIEYNVQQ